VSISRNEIAQFVDTTGAMTMPPATLGVTAAGRPCLVMERLRGRTLLLVGQALDVSFAP